MDAKLSKSQHWVVYNWSKKVAHRMHFANAALQSIS